MSTQVPTQRPESVLVTGGCGFLGHHVVKQLLQTYPPPSTKISVIDLYTEKNRQPDVTYHSADLGNQAQIRSLVEQIKPDVVIHTASPVMSGNDAETKKRMWRTNVDGTRLVMEESRRVGTGVFVHTSSASVVSDTRTDLINADERYGLVKWPLQREWYSHTKSEAEQLVLAANDRFSSPPFLTVAVRPVSMFGEGDVQLIPNLVTALREGKTKYQLGENDNLFDFVYVGNVASAHLLAMSKLLALQQRLASSARRPRADAEKEEDEPDKADGEAFVITNTTPVYFFDMARFVQQRYYVYSHAHPPPASSSMALPPAPAPVASVRIFPWWLAITLANIASWLFWLLRLPSPQLNPVRVRYACMTRYFKPTKAVTRLGYKPLFRVEEGVDRTVKWFWERELAQSEKKAS